MAAKMIGQMTSATTTVRVMTTQDATSCRLLPSTWSQQYRTVSFAEADGNSESSATKCFLGREGNASECPGGRPPDAQPKLRILERCNRPVRGARSAGGTGVSERCGRPR